MASNLMRQLSQLIDEEALDGFLADLGLQRRSSSIFSAISLFVAGVVAGAAVGLIYAPRSGQQMREDLASRAAALRERLEDKVQSATKKGERYNPPS
jgi:hypothetical protein